MAALSLRRLNHILIPSTKAGRDRLRRSALGHLGRPFGFLYDRLSGEGAALLVTSLLVGFFALEVRRTDVHLLWAASVALLVASVLAGRFVAMSQVAVTVDTPLRVVVGEPLEIGVTLRNEGPRVVEGVRVEGPFLPWDGKWVVGNASVPRLLSGGREWVRLSATFRQRGEHHLDVVRARALVPLGLATSKPVTGAGPRFLVVPRPAQVTDLPLRLARRFHRGGVALASRVGDSHELLGVRPYRPGDRVRDLHARSWARAGVPVVREREEEFFRRVGVALDVEVPPGCEAAFEAALSVVAGAVERLARGDALVDVLVMGDVAHDLTLGRALGSVERCLDVLACAEAGAPFDADVLKARLEAHGPNLSAVLLVTTQWTDAHRKAEAELAAVGLPLRAVCVCREGAPHPEGVTVVTAEAVVRGEAVHL